ncbi:uncharacterized protein SPSK_07476 [Sporothrix schenckii 1099-18]|uniref:Phosphatidic acid phosphatase type 2/haloperoxidase domain-containing protein n=1 Tax=Sporothrix schenckii 1099-18 TaxID=1397361 RepID=A0A0F2MEK3_SPOSC|nr:uncharacterized protein SPSK_07476 [Sporothrix schenckii 1099-18]KJR88057.1 hypothetical protein SPSK_07476 [Sporothrix schenckii 1099-18]
MNSDQLAQRVSTSYSSPWFKVSVSFDFPTWGSKAEADAKVPVVKMSSADNMSELLLSKSVLDTVPLASQTTNPTTSNKPPPPPPASTVDRVIAIVRMVVAFITAFPLSSYCNYFCSVIHCFLHCYCWFCHHVCCVVHCFLHCCCICCRCYFCFVNRMISPAKDFGVFAAKWIRYSIVDIITILATTTTAGILFQLYLSKPPASRSFAVFNHNNEVVYPQFAFPLRDEIIPSWLAIFLGPFVPVVILVLLQLYVRSFWDANNAIFGVLYSLSNSVVFQVIIKWLIGGLRPHFLDVCKPDLSLAKTLPPHRSAYIASGFNNMYYTREICTGDPRQINDALSSFPSGHTTAGFAGFVFLSLYLNGKFKIFSHQHTQLWKLHLFYAPILVATLIGGALTIDAFHNWYDIVAGAAIGTTMAFSAYRMTYAAVFDPRYNHIPLHRNRPFDYDAIVPSNSGLTYLDHSRL